ncbi:MAG TPA: hypothetical protein VFZ41_08700 [Solirubrobacterales bacterium]
MTPHSKFALPLLAAIALAGAALGLSACGYESTETEVVEGEPVTLGELEYIATFSRFLNLNDNEDSGYLVGKPTPPPGSAYFGVFFEVQNESDETQRLADSMSIHDADGEEYEALESESPFAFPFGDEVEEEEQIPVLDSTAQQGPIEGSVVLFELPASASDARPLILEIPGPGGPAEVTLDL